jgi:uridylate kinase
MVIGGGNIFRGLQGSAQGMERTTADYMGMLATVMNALAMQSALESMGVYTRVSSVRSRWTRSANPTSAGAPCATSKRKARGASFAAGTGNPYFTTDTAATLRANEMSVRGDLQGHEGRWHLRQGPQEARRRPPLRHDQLRRGAGRSTSSVMDASAIALARDNDVPIIVFSLDEPGGFRGILAGRGTYTKVVG